VTCLKDLSGELIFRVGTDNVDDYYPSFVCEWNPAGLSVNFSSKGTSGEG